MHPQGAIPPEVQLSKRGVRTLEFSYVSVCTWRSALFGVTLFDSEVLRRVLFLPFSPCWRRFNTFLVCDAFLSLFASLLRAVRLDLRFPLLGALFAPWRFVIFLVSAGLAARKTRSTLCF